MAKTLKFGENGKWATKTGSSMAYNDQNDNFKPAPFTTERATSATRVNKQGLIEVVGNDKLRIDYKDSSNGVALLEPVRTNLINYSEDVSNGWWNKYSGANVESTKVTSPSGEVDAYQVTYDGTTNGRIEKAITGVTLGAAYTFSFYARVSSGTQDFIYGHYQSQNGTLTTEWQRFIITENENDTTSYPRIQCDEAATIEVYGIQLEQGSYPTSYIPTSGSSVTRAADVADGAGNAQVFNDSEGVLYANIAALEQTTSASLAISDGSTSDTAVSLYYYNNGIAYDIFNTSTTISGAFLVSDERKAIFNKISLKYKSGDVALWVNGFEVDTDTTSFSFGDSLDQLAFDYGSGSFPFYGKTKEIGYYDTALTDAELEALTSYTSFTNMANELNLTIK